MPLYSLGDPLPPLAAPVIVAAFDGWVDAAGAASAATARLGADGDLVARFAGDVLFDYRARRPILDVVDGRLGPLVWPELAIRRVRVGGRDVLVFTGAEPDFRWESLGADVAELALRLGVVQWISLGAVPAAVSHRRPVPVMATASADGLLHGDEVRGPAGTLRVPAAALSALELAVTSVGIPAVGFFAQVPPYVGAGYAAATVTLLEHVARHLGVEIAVSDLVDEAQRERRRYDAAIESDPETREIVARLGGLPDDDDADLPSGDDLAREIQRFLREQGDDGPDGPGLADP